jgi:hypothetical protein
MINASERIFDTLVDTNKLYVSMRTYFTIRPYKKNPKKGLLRDIDGWLRNRLRYCIWTYWKKPERKRKTLMRLVVDKDHAYA